MKKMFGSIQPTGAKVPGPLSSAKRSRPNRYARRLLIALLALHVVMIGALLVMAGVPPVSRDALTHHLAIPKLYLAHGGLIELPDIPFSYYPMNLDLLYLIPLAFGNDILPKYIHLLFGVLTAWLIYRYLKARTDRLLGLCGSLLYLSTPMVARLSTEVYVDLGLGFFSMAALAALLDWSQSQQNKRGLVLAGVWCGLALGTKYNALLVLAILALIIPFIYTRIKMEPAAAVDGQSADALIPPTKKHAAAIKGRGALVSAIIFAAVAITVFSPWMIRNSVLTGNPIYPMMDSVFNPRDAQATGDWSRTSTMVQETSNTLTVRRMVFQESFGYIALIPLRIFFEGRDDDPRYFDGRLNPFLLVFIIGAIGFWRIDNHRLAKERWVWFSFALLFILMAVFLAPIRIRYLLPVLPAFIVLAVTGIYNFGALVEAMRHPIARFTGYMVLAAAVFAMFGLNADYIVKRYRHVEPWAYLSGHLSRDEYIAKRRPEYPLIKYANAHLTPDARILALFLGQRRYYFDRDVVFNEGWLIKAVKEADSPEAIKQSLQTRGITHLMVRRDLFQQWLPITLTPSEIERMLRFWNSHIRKLRDHKGFELYVIV